MITFKELIGYDLHTSRVAFEHEGLEIVFIQDFIIFKRRIYVNGELVFNRFSPWLGLITHAEFDFQGHQYRFLTRTTNFACMSQDVTVWVDGHQAGRKQDPVYAGLPIRKLMHAIIGPLIFGMTLGMFVETVF